MCAKWTSAGTKSAWKYLIKWKIWKNRIGVTTTHSSATVKIDLLSILLTQPCETCNCLLISHGRIPCTASCRIWNLRKSGRGRPLVKIRPYWFTFFPAESGEANSPFKEKLFDKSKGQHAGGNIAIEFMYALLLLLHDEFLAVKIYMLYRIPQRATLKPPAGQMWPVGRILPTPTLASWEEIDPVKLSQSKKSYIQYNIQYNIQ